MKRFLSLFLSVWAAGSLSAAAQNTAWHDPMDSTATAASVRGGSGYVHGRGFASNDYGRLPGSARGVVRDAVWNLAQNSAGLYLRFTTDSPQIAVRYTVAGGHAMPHMPATGVSGVDLYNERGERCWGDYSFGDPIVYTYRELPDTTETTTYTLYLPLYNTVKELQVGVRAGSEFAFEAADTTFAERLPVVIYGTSIAQGACASRPGMAWSNILQRNTGLPTVNLGFSGNGRLEPEVIDYVATVPAALYIVDCMPNMYVSEDSVYRLVLNAVRQFRRLRPKTPILLVEHPGYANRSTNATKRGEDERADRAQRRAYAELRREGVRDLYYLSRRELGMPRDGMVDYIHPSDLGMTAYATAYQRALRKILQLK
ncbi:MAG: SGNH/GDSL hydrolase family protein [Rikenella sp.]|nr:SGNH/GDSL hydrolase family protein [Rikenella sp.]